MALRNICDDSSYENLIETLHFYHDKAGLAWLCLMAGVSATILMKEQNKGQFDLEEYLTLVNRGRGTMYPDESYEIIVEIGRLIASLDIFLLEQLIKAKNDLWRLCTMWGQMIDEGD